MSTTAVTIISEEIGIADGVRTGTRVYQIDVDDADTTAEDMLSASDGTTSIPGIGDLWATGSNAKVTGKKASRVDDDPYTFQVSVDYSSKTDPSGSNIENPLSRPTVYSYGGSNMQEPYFRDTADTPVVNSAGEPFADMPQRDITRGTINITKNVASFNDANAETYRNKINAASVTINGSSYPEKTLKIDSISANGPNVENGVTYWTQTTTISKNPDTWEPKIEDRGLNQLDANGKLVAIIDGQNHPVVLPYPLDGSGKAKSLPTDTPAQGTLKPYETASFAATYL